MMTVINYNIREINHHHVLPCKTCLIIQWMQRYPHPQMRTRRPLPICLLYTSDAADDSLRVDLGGRRIIKKKKK